LEKRRQAMLDMPQMIQTWKEVSYLVNGSMDAANNEYRGVMVVDGRSGRNKFSRCCRGNSGVVQLYHVVHIVLGMRIAWRTAFMKNRAKQLPACILYICIKEHDQESTVSSAIQSLSKGSNDQSSIENLNSFQIKDLLKRTIDP
jgi:hypothetical protein